ncbi:MAG: hypothetical protein JO370_00390 [Paucibacter sp.]|nr:hypothetical protein [Roseateles sp.]
MRFTSTLRFFRRTPPSHVQHDPADMGTAFGMEASLGGEFSEMRAAQLDGPLESQCARSDARSGTGDSPLAWMTRTQS